MALHLQGSIAHDTAIAAASGGDGGNGDGGGEAAIAVMVGAEYEGVSDEAAGARRDVRIPMSDAMEGSLDALSVNVAASIVLERVFAASQPSDVRGVGALRERSRC